MTAPSTDVLVVGAGPTGLTLALQAHLHGARVRIVERRTEAFRPSRAMIMHPRTLEVLRPLGVTEALLGRGDPAPSMRLHLGSRVVPVRVADLDLPDTAFPHLLLIRQAEVEAVLDAALGDAGVGIERGAELVGLRREHSRCVATVERGDVREEIDCSYVAGCDGLGSTVRARAGIDWHSARYRQEVVLADIELTGTGATGADVVAARSGLLFLFSGGEQATWRMLATRPAPVGEKDFEQLARSLPEAEVRALLADSGLGGSVNEVAWAARAPLQHGLAARYRTGRFFVAGDAAHAHSPAGAQGMNLGIQDATNLGWKLALGSAPRLLDSYQAERRPVARRALVLTRAIFWAEAGTDLAASTARGVLAPLVAPLVPVVLRRRRLLAEGVRTLSGLRVSYPASPVNADAGETGSGMPSPGERVPDSDVSVDGRRLRLHELLARPGIHVLLQREAEQPEPSGSRAMVHVHRLTSWPGKGVLAVRPDGYAGFRSGKVDRQLGDWLALVADRTTTQAGEAPPGLRRHG